MVPHEKQTLWKRVDRPWSPRVGRFVWVGWVGNETTNKDLFSEPPKFLVNRNSPLVFRDLPRPVGGALDLVMMSVEVLIRIRFETHLC